MLTTQFPLRLPLFSLLLTLLSMTTALAQTPASSSQRYAIAIHGGAGLWQIDQSMRKEVDATMHRALTHGRDLLARGGASLDAVEQVIQILEDAPVFNAGKGSVFNAQGKHELDASIMDGRDRSSGAVAGVRVAKNPIAVARLVMTQTDHVLLTGDGADDFVQASGANIAPKGYFWTPQLREQWQKEQKQAPDHHGTVGCVALDMQGNLAAGTSTGGMSMKRFGRVGDSPLIGSGTWADNATCAISCTGHGELFIRDHIAYDVAARVAYGKSDLPSAVRHHLHQSLAKGTGGLIAIDASGQIVLEFNTAAMPRAAADSSGRFDVRFDDKRSP